MRYFVVAHNVRLPLLDRKDLLGIWDIRNIIFFPIEVAIVEAYNVRLPLLDRKDEIGNRDIRNNVKGMK